MDTVPPDHPPAPVNTQPPENNTKIIKFSAPRAPSRRVTEPPASKARTMDLKVKLENYRSIFNTSPKGSAVEKQALLKLAEMVTQLPDDDKDKHEFLRVAVDFYEGDELDKAALFANLLKIAPDIADKEEQLKAYRILMRNKLCDDASKEVIGTKMLQLLDTL